MRYCEFVQDYKDVHHENQMVLAVKGERGVLDGYTSGSEPKAIVIKDNGDIVVCPLYFIKVRYIAAGENELFEC